MKIKLSKKGFYHKEKKTFKTGKFDIMVIILVAILFLYSLFFLSFRALTIDGEIVYNEYYWHETGDPRIPIINDFVIIGSLICVYEMLLIRLEGKHKGRYIEWGLYYRLFQYQIHLKIQEGKDQTKKFMNRK